MLKSSDFNEKQEDHFGVSLSLPEEF